MIEQLRSLPRDVPFRMVPYALVAAVIIGVPSDLIDTPLFGRPVETRPLDYVILAITALLIGLIFAIRVPDDEVDETRTVWGGFAAFLAVGCPVCNQAVVALIGTSGALSWWAPVQPLVGLAAIGLLVYALKRRLDTYQLTSCPIPEPESDPVR